MPLTDGDPYLPLTRLICPQPNSTKKYATVWRYQFRHRSLTHVLPVTIRKKFYLVLFAGQPASAARAQVPAGLGTEEAGHANGDRVAFERKRERTKTRSGNKRKPVKDVDWVLRKKELYRTRGKADVPRDSKCVSSFTHADRLLH